MEKETFKTYRKNLGLSQTKLSKLLSISRSTISYWENGTHKISMPKMVDLALKQLSNEMGISLENKIA